MMCKLLAVTVKNGYSASHIRATALFQSYLHQHLNSLQDTAHGTAGPINKEELVTCKHTFTTSDALTLPEHRLLNLPVQALQLTHSKIGVADQLANQNVYF